MKVAVARAADFAPGERRIVTIGRRSIGVFRVGDRFYALNNLCPHQGGPLCQGRTEGWVTASEPGRFEVTGEGELIKCPWHGWEYELSTGQSYMRPGDGPVRGFGVSVESGQELDGAALPDPPPWGRRVPGPYIAETFDVSVEDDYVVVDTSPAASQEGGS